jgi:ribosomal protein S18 acetylase RimI-like enzyme
MDVTTWYLEMLSPDQLLPATAPATGDVRIVQATIASPEFSRYLFTGVGGHWYWMNRVDWDFAEWLAYLDRPEVETLVLYVSGTPAGYVELETHADDQIEITCFGLLPRFFGQRLGGYLLTAGIERGWSQGARRVFVHTCSLDGPRALANYRARGFQVYDEKTASLSLPASPPGPWPESGYTPG